MCKIHYVQRIVTVMILSALGAVAATAAVRVAPCIHVTVSGASVGRVVDILTCLIFRKQDHLIPSFYILWSVNY